MVFIAVLCSPAFALPDCQTTASTAASSFNPDSRQGSDECESLDFLQEANRITKTDIAKRSAMSNYCLHFDRKKNGIWKLLLYERIDPMPIRIRKECRVYSISPNANLEELFQDKLPITNGGCIKTCTGNCEKASKECLSNLYETYSIYDYINYFDINNCFRNIDADRISYLFYKYIPIKLELEVSCDGVREKIPTEKHYIYVSGICSEEQLRKNRGYDKYKSKEDENL
jgi:hypothetical protein